jgi:hypothetical protein
MSVFVAVRATRMCPTQEHPGFPESPGRDTARIPRMTGFARDFPMATPQGVDRGSMAGDRVSRRAEALHVVACLAIRTPSGQGRLPTVRIGMASAAGPEWWPIHSPGPTAVASFARQGRVPATQRVAGPVVIEGLPGDLAERTGGVATGARRSEATGVGIPMARGAFLMRNRLVQGNRRARADRRGSWVCGEMALLALDRGVLPGQRIGSPRMVEAGSRLPGPLVMALPAFGGERPAVMVLMTGDAGRIEAQPALSRFRAHEQTRSGRTLERRLVAVSTPYLGMTSLERPSGSSVVERLRPALRPVSQGEAPAGVIWMTAGAVLLRLASMEAEPLLDQRADLSMTVLAAVVHRSGAAFVALQAAEFRVEPSVRLREWTRRHLSEDPGGRARGRHDQHRGGHHRSEAEPPARADGMFARRWRQDGVAP